MAKSQAAKPEVEVVTDQDRVKAEKDRPLLTITTGIGQTFHVKIKQPAGRALLIAVHL
jgi:hypothetical protein